MTEPSTLPELRGYFAIGAERMSKALNLGNLMRSAHGFGAHFTFTVGATYHALEARADTSKGQWHLPHYNWETIPDMTLPQGCVLVGIELTDDAIDLPTFKHPLRAAYILGPEHGSLSPAILERCQYVVKIPTRFCVNVAMAGAIVMYDRIKSMGNWPNRPLMPGGSIEQKPAHVRGGQFIRSNTENRKVTPTEKP
ncbi:MAG: RNA methyltransferase [Hyphomicrobiaceae bacterium]|nr:RNA methyltransferase [Hyphomicrobiaceae bacterium]